MLRAHHTITTRSLTVAILAAATLVAAGCGSDDGTTDTGTTGEGGIPPYATDVAQRAEDLGCSVSAPEQLGADHVASIDDVDYSSDPPSSGPHFADWAWWGFYSEPVHDGYVIHNLEHGGVALWYGDDVAQERLDALRDDMLERGDKWVVTPRDGLDGMASAAWGVLLECDRAALDGMDDEAFRGLLDDWYESVNSQETDVEATVPPVGPQGDPSQLDPPLPEPARNVSTDA